VQHQFLRLEELASWAIESNAGGRHVGRETNQLEHEWTEPDVGVLPVGCEETADCGGRPPRAEAAQCHARHCQRGKQVRRGRILPQL